MDSRFQGALRSLVALLVAAAAWATPGAAFSQTTWYIAPDGDDDNQGSREEPWGTFTHAFGAMVGGDTLVLLNGVYMRNYMIDPPSGSTEQHTTIRADHDGEAVVDLDFDTGVPGSSDAALIITSEHVTVEGLKLLNGQEAVAILSGSDLVIRRTAFGNAAGGTYDSVLIEDCWMWGQARALVQVSGMNITLRRIVMRNDYYPGEHESNEVLLYGAQHVIVENAISLDFNPAVHTEHVREGYSAVDHNFYGCIAVNLPDEPLGGYWGFELAVANAENCVAWDIPQNGFRQEGWNAEYHIDHVTAGAIESDPISVNNMPVTQSLTNPSLQYLVLPEGENGATITHRYHDGVVTDEVLWPWPNEARIKADFAESFENMPLEYQNADRGFVVEGTGLYGGPITLTSYIWEYLGHPCPSEVCEAAFVVDAGVTDGAAEDTAIGSDSGTGADAAIEPGSDSGCGCRSMGSAGPAAELIPCLLCLLFLLAWRACGSIRRSFKGSPAA